MALRIACPKCNGEFDLRPDAVPGRLYSCPLCEKTFQVAVGSSLALSLRREQALSGLIFDANVLADDLIADCNRLLKLGILLDKGALGAKATGIAGGAFAAAQGHWLVGAAVAVAGLLANVLTEDWKRIKLAEVRQKWFSRLTTMDQPQLAEFLSAVQYRHPALTLQARNLLASSCSVQ